MTTYFTAVGSLSEGGRANATDINDREAAVTAGFTAIEVVVAPVSGASSISYGTNWSNNGPTTLKKQLGTMIHLNAEALAAGSPGAAQMTLPSGYRPATTTYCAGMYFDASAVAYFPALVTITTAGVVTIIGLNSTTQITPAVGDVAYCNATFFTS